MLGLILSVTLMAVLIFPACDSEDPTKPREPGWTALGFDDFAAWELELDWPYLYACAGSHGVFRTDIRADSDAWQYIGLADSAMADSSFDSRTVFSVTDVGVSTAGHILASATSFAEWFPGLYRSDDDGISWTRSDSGIVDEYCPFESNVSSVEIADSDNRLCFAGTEGSIYRSEDGGKHWTHVSGWVCVGLGIRDIEIHQRDNSIVWAGGQTGRFSPDLRKSSDGGRTWEIVYIQQFVPGDNVVRAIATDPFDPAVAIVSPIRGSILTNDGGDTWKSPAFPWAAETSPHIVAFDNRRSGHMFVSVGNTVFESWSGGDTAELLEGSDLSTVLAMVYDSRRRDLYVGTYSGVHSYHSQ
jgi:photosystem II stability/assembly factor-like uncharacterized protein